MSAIFDLVLYAPLFNLLVFLYNTVAFDDFGVAIIFLTVMIRLLMSPLSIRAFRSQKILSDLQPKIQEVQKKFKSDPQKQTREVMALYKQHNTNPFSGCFLLLIQLPVLFALYRVSIAGFAENSLSVLYHFVRKPEFLNPLSLGIFDLTKRSVFLSLVAGVIQFFQMKWGFPRKREVFEKNQAPNPAASLNKQMLYFFPLITIIVSLSFPAGLPLYWIATTAFSILEQFYVNKSGRSRATGPQYGESDSKSNFRNGQGFFR